MCGILRCQMEDTMFLYEIQFEDGQPSDWRATKGDALKEAKDLAETFEVTLVEWNIGPKLTLEVAAKLASGIGFSHGMKEIWKGGPKEEDNESI